MRRMARFNRTNNRSNRSNRSSGFNKPQSPYAFSLLTAGISAIVGFLMSTPFWFFIFFVGHESTMSIWRTLAVILYVVGGPIMLMGLIGITALRSQGGRSQLESDVSRIRFATETQMMNDLMKGK